jgi:hypothetical protein
MQNVTTWLQLSVVQGSASLQSASMLQQPDTLRWPQVCVERLQLSTVQRLPSRHWLLSVQQPAMAEWLQV